jgi:hypothetical protein
VEKYLDFEVYFDITRDPFSLSVDELRKLARLAVTHSTEHPDGGIRFPEGMQEAGMTYMRRLTLATFRFCTPKAKSGFIAEMLQDPDPEARAIAAAIVKEASNA